MSSRDFASITVAPMSVEPGQDGNATTFSLPKSSEDSETAAEIAADPGKPSASRTSSQEKMQFKD